MKTIVLITREKEGKVTHVSVHLCGNYDEAGRFCHFVNGLTLEGGKKLAAREAIANREYSLLDLEHQNIEHDEDDLDLSMVSGSNEKENVVLVFRGSKGITDTVSVSLINSDEEADHYCNLLNDLKLAQKSFIYAIHAKEMVEYETTKPMLTRFDEIFKYCEFLDEFQGTKIVRETLSKFSARTLLQAFKGLDKSSRELIMQLLPIKTADEINEIINQSDKHETDLFTLSQIRKAREKITNAVSKNAQEFLDRVLTGQEDDILKE